jgi:small subunit ribosomal protein S1
MEAYINEKYEEFIKETKHGENSYSAKVISKNNGGFIVDIDGIEAFLPGGQAAANKIINFDDMIGKDIMVMFEDYIKEGNTFIVSNKKYIQTVLPDKIRALDTQVQYHGYVTGTVPFGIFIEFDGIFTGLLHVSEMKMETSEDFRNKKIKPGQSIDFYIKEVTKDLRLILSDFESVEESTTIEEFQLQCEGTIQNGEIINIKPNLGLFIKFDYGNNKFIGLLHYKEIKNLDNFTNGQKINCLITKVLPENKKIFLKLVKEKNIE